LTFDLDIQTHPSEETSLPSEFGANPFSGSQDIQGTNKKRKTIAKDVLTNIHHMQAASSSRTPVAPGGHGMVLSAAARYLECMAHGAQCIVNGNDATVFPFLSLGTVTFDLGIQTRPGAVPNTSSL